MNNAKDVVKPLSDVICQIGGKPDMYYIVCIGTTSVKMLALDEKGSVVKSAVKEYPIYSPSLYVVGAEPEDWYIQTVNGLGNS